MFFYVSVIIVCKLYFLSLFFTQDYKKPLEEASPQILSSSKISMLFCRVPELLQCHTLFRIALAEAVANWDRDHRIGDVFVASFSKSIVLEIYSGFINNFSVAMDLARSETKRKANFAEFLRVSSLSRSFIIHRNFDGVSYQKFWI